MIFHLMTLSVLLKHPRRINTFLSVYIFSCSRQQRQNFDIASTDQNSTEVFAFSPNLSIPKPHTYAVVELTRPRIAVK